MKKHSIIGVIGGTGLYQLSGIKILEEVRVPTPFGDPSDLLVRTIIDETEVIFLPRHGRKHNILPGEINYRANIYALKSLGATWCCSVSAVGSLIKEAKPGDIVVPDQTIDRTKSRKDSFFGEGIVAHVSMADPYCPVLRQAIIEAAKEVAVKHNFDVHSSGTYICIEGPTFSSRAESKVFKSYGASIIGMTNLPEAKLAREAELGYATIALVTDYDCWKEDEPPVEASHVLQVLNQNAKNAQNILVRVIHALKDLAPSHIASEALKNAIYGDLKGSNPKTLEHLKPILSKYLA